MDLIEMVSVFSNNKLLLLCLVSSLCLILSSAASSEVQTNKKSNPTDYDVEAYLDISYYDHRNHTAITTRIVGMFGLNSRRVEINTEVVHVRSRYGDHDGCDYVDDWNIPQQGPWIALVARGECSFEQKITNLHKKYNADAVIIYNNVKEPLFIVNHTPMDVVTVLISKKDGEFIGDLFDHGVVVKMLITGEKLLTSRKAADQASLQLRSAHEYRRSRAVMAVSILVIIGVCIGFLVLLISTIHTVMASSNRHKKTSSTQRDGNKKTWPILAEA